MTGYQYQSSSNSWVLLPSQDDSTNPETPSQSDSEALANKAASHSSAPTQQIKTEDLMPLRKDSTHDLLEDDSEDLCNTVKEEEKEISLNARPPTFQSTCNQDRIESNRQKEFEESSSRARAATRPKAEQTSINGDEATRAQCRATENDNMEEARTRPELIKQGSNSVNTGGEQTVPEQRFIIVTPRIQAPWVDEAYSVCKASKKVR